MVMENEDRVLDAPTVVSLILKANTIVSKYKIVGDVVGLKIHGLPREFLPTKFRVSGMSSFTCFLKLVE